MPIRPPALDDRGFDDLVADLVRRIPAHTPEWTNFNAADPGITLVQLFAHVTESTTALRKPKFLSLNRVRISASQVISLTRS